MPRPLLPHSCSIPALIICIGAMFCGPAHAQPDTTLQIESEAPEVTPIQTTEERSLAYPIKYVLFYQTVGLGILNSLDRETTEWEAFSFDNFVDGFESGPEQDGNSAFFNWFLHPLWGSETYLRARSQRYEWWESFLFSTASSVVWEYGMENFVTHPSTPDLLITSTFGSVLGEVRYRLKSDWVGSDDERYRMLAIAIDPIQTVTEMVGDALGYDWREPAYREARAAQQTAFLDISPTVSSKGDIGLAMRYEVQF